MAVIQDPNKVQQNGPQGSPSGQPLQTIGTATPAGTAPSGSPTATTQANNLAQRQGSGRFTNLQKYIQANQGAGSRIAGQIGQKVDQNIQKEQDKASNYYQQLGHSIEASKQAADQGQGFKSQLQNIGTQIQGAGLTPEQLANPEQAKANLAARPQQNLSGIEQFTQSPNFQKFQDIQAGRGIDESLLALQQQKAAGQAQTAQQTAQQANQQLSSEGGRFQLLQNAFGGANRPGYTTGQQRLDQALLGGNLGSVQSDVGARLKSAQELAKQAGGQSQEVSRLAQQEKDLISGINTQAGTNEQAYLNMLKSYINPLNQQRSADVADLQSGISSFNNPYQNGGDGQRQTGFTADQMSRLGLTDQNQGVYNVFKGQQGVGGVNDVHQVATIGTEAKNAQDVANKQDLARYQALTKIIGKDATDNLTNGTGKVGEDVIGKSWENKQGNESDQSLKSRLDAAQTQFDTASKKSLDYRNSPSTVFKYTATPEELLAKGRDAMGIKYNAPYNPNNTTNYSTAQDRMEHAPYYNNIINQYKDFINQQNYNQTLGGQRQTFLDTEAAKALADKGITPKADGTPITGMDPSLQYLNDIVGKMPVKGN